MKTFNVLQFTWKKDPETLMCPGHDVLSRFFLVTLLLVLYPSQESSFQSHQPKKLACRAVTCWSGPSALSQELLLSQERLVFPEFSSQIKSLFTHNTNFTFMGALLVYIFICVSFTGFSKWSFIFISKHISCVPCYVSSTGWSLNKQLLVVG